MKKIFCILSVAAVLFGAFSCKPKEDPIDVNDITEDGVYVTGEATGATAISAAYGMAKGHNEAKDNVLRDGMYEKYIVLEGGKEFSLVYVSGGAQTAYGATLAEFTPEALTGIYDANPATPVLKGNLVIGSSAPKMKVSATGLYHIVLDLNLANDLDAAQIVVSPVQYGVRGGMNSWNFTALEATAPKNDGITFTLSDQELGNNGEFKFAYNGAWKITLDSKGEVKANTNLGADCIPGGSNIVVSEGAGKYKITLTYKLAAGDISNSFKYEIKQESKAEYPANVYMTGVAWGAWTWGSEGVVELQHISAGGDPKDGCFVVTRYFKADDGFKFSTINVKDDWSKAFAGMTTNSDNFTWDGDGNIHVPADGLWTITLDFTADKMTLTEGMVYGMGPCFNDDWTTGKYAGEVNADGTVSITTLSAGNIRVYAPCAFDWWQHEFQPNADGQIVYREGGELEGFAVEAGVTLTFDFNAGTVTTGSAGFVSHFGVKWDDIESIANDGGTIKSWKYTNDDNNLYFYYVIDSSDIKDKDGSYNWRRYIFVGLDTDNNPATGLTASMPAGLTLTGLEAIASVYPFRGTVPEGSTYPEGVEFVNGEDAQGDIECPAGTVTGKKVSAYGYRDGAEAYLEIAIPREAIGSPAAGTYNVQHSFSWNLTEAKAITVK